ncbi:MAG: AraC family transcriptional regulator [Acidobacteriota bacterium]|nr:AraC family transcriptional regulator [Acidobacteriota bacterium]
MRFPASRKKFDGIASQRREFPDFSLAELIYPSNLEVLAHAHDQANFCIAIEGGCTEIYGRKIREYRPFTLNFLPPHQTHSLKSLSVGMRAFSIEIAPQWLERMREYSLNVENSVHCSGGILIQLLMRLYHEFKNLDEASPLAVEGLTLEMLAEVSRLQIINKESSPPYWLKQARDIIHEQFSIHLSLDPIAREVGVHPVHLARMFRKHYRCTVGEYVRRMRVENACRKMVTTQTPLIEIALASGFSDQSHFTRIFKRLKGLTPAEYRAEFNAR